MQTKKRHSTEGSEVAIEKERLQIDKDRLEVWYNPNTSMFFFFQSLILSKFPVNIST